MRISSFAWSAPLIPTALSAFLLWSCSDRAKKDADLDSGEVKAEVGADVHADTQPDASMDAACGGNSRFIYIVPGCGSDAKPLCAFRGIDSAAVLVPYCGCDGRSFNGGLDHAEQPFRAQGFCPDGGIAPDATADRPRDDARNLDVPPEDAPADAVCGGDSRFIYTAPGCGGAAKPLCAFRGIDAAAVAVTYCGCDGHNFQGGQYAEQPYRAWGPCPDAGVPPANPAGCPAQDPMPNSTCSLAAGQCEYVAERCASGSTRMRLCACTDGKWSCVQDLGCRVDEPARSTPPPACQAACTSGQRCEYVVEKCPANEDLTGSCWCGNGSVNCSRSFDCYPRLACASANGRNCVTLGSAFVTAPWCPADAGTCQGSPCKIGDDRHSCVRVGGFTRGAVCVYGQWACPVGYALPVP